MKILPLKTAHLASLLLLLAAPAFADDAEEAAWDAFEAADLEFQGSQLACDEADAQTTGGDRACRNAIEDGLSLARAVGHVLELPSLDEDTRESAIDLLLTTQQIVGTYMVDVGDCADAEAILSSVLDNPLLGNRRRLEQATRTWQRDAETCTAEQELLLADPNEERVEVQEPVEFAETPDESGSGQTAGYVLTGIGAAAVLAGVGWELALMDDRQDFIDERELCEGGAPQCDPAALQANANTVNGAKLPTGLLYGVGGAALVTGVILLATSGSDSDEPSASITPMLGRTTLGLNVAAEF